LFGYFETYYCNTVVDYFTTVAGYVNTVLYEIVADRLFYTDWLFYTDRLFYTDQLFYTDWLFWYGL